MVNAIKSIYNAISGFFSFVTTFLIPKAKESIEMTFKAFRICIGIANHVAPFPPIFIAVALSVLTIVIAKLVLGRQ